MSSGNSKRVVIIRDIPSNIIEEAILVLKAEPGKFSAEGSKAPSAKKNRRDNSYLLKEAEQIINNYIKESRSGSPGAGQINLGVRKPQTPVPLNLTINLALSCSILLLIFVISKIFLNV